MTPEEQVPAQEVKNELPAAKPKPAKKLSEGETPVEAAAPALPVDNKIDPSVELAKVRAELEQMKKDQSDLEEAALERAAKLAGIQVEDILAIEKSKKEAKELIECNIGSQVVHINGVPYSGTFTVPLEMAEVIMHAASAYRHQKMKESVGSQYQVMGGFGGPMTTRQIKQFAPGEI